MKVGSAITPDKERRIRRLLAMGTCAPDIAYEVNLHVKTVEGYLRRKESPKVGRPPVVSGEKERLARELHGQGKHDHEIAKALSIATTTARRWRRLAGLKSNPYVRRPRGGGSHRLTETVRGNTAPCARCGAPPSKVVRKAPPLCDSCIDGYLRLWLRESAAGPIGEERTAQLMHDYVRAPL
jgi:transposase